MSMSKGKWGKGSGKYQYMNFDECSKSGNSPASSSESLTLEDADRIVASVNDVHKQIKKNAELYQALEKQLRKTEKIQHESSTTRGANLAWRRRKDLIARMKALLDENKVLMIKHPTAARSSNVELMNEKYSEALSTTMG